jgi:hypothetical protein
MDCPISNNGAVFSIHDWLNYLQGQAAVYRKLVEQADDPLIKSELLALASVCDDDRAMSVECQTRTSAL